MEPLPDGCVHIHMRDGVPRLVYMHLDGLPKDGIVHLVSDEVIREQDLESHHPGDSKELKMTGVYLDRQRLQMEHYSGATPEALLALQEEPVCELQSKKLDPEELQKILQKFDFDRYLGGGSYGIAFLLKDHTVLKITCDQTEGKAASFLVGKRLENVAEVYEVYRLPKSDLHVIVMEYIPDSLADDDSFGEYLHEIILKVLYTPGVSKKEKMILAIEYLREEPFDENSDMSNGVSYALEALEKAGVVWLDFHNGNMGMKGGRLYVYDIGQSQSPGGQVKTLSKNERYSGLKIALRQQIEWIKPDLQEEVGEYFENEATQKFLRSYGFEFQSEEELLKVLAKGSPSKVDKKLLKRHGKNLTLTTEDFESELNDPEYARSYQDMKKRLVEDKKISLPMPILLKVEETYWGFAGNRRMNLAWGLNLPVMFYVVNLSKSENGTL